MINRLIPIQAESGKQTVSARDLHQFLDVKSRFNDWITSRIDAFGFVEGEDYVSLTEKIVSGNNATSKVYHVSLDMAKELAMVERSEKGKQARRYFIECERQLIEQRSQPTFSIPQTYQEALRLAADQADLIDEQRKQLEEAAPKVAFVDRVMETNGAVLMETAVKIAKLPYGRNQMFQKLREDGIFMSVGKDRHNIPYQQYINQGLLTVKPSFREDNNGQTHPNPPTALVTQKGIAWLIKNYGAKEATV